MTRAQDTALPGRVRLRPLQADDLPVLHRWYQTPELSTHLVDDIPPRGEAEAVGFMRAWLDHDPANLRFAVTRAADGRLLGRTALLGVAGGSAELHLFLGDLESRGRGHGRAAVEALLELAFEEIGLEEVRLEVLASNAAARKLYLAAGFQETGVRPTPAIKAGREVEVVRMAIRAADRHQR